MARQFGNIKRLSTALLLVALFYVSAATYLHFYFRDTRLDGWNGGQVKVRYFTSKRQRAFFWPAVVLESLTAGQAIHVELEK